MRLLCCSILTQLSFLYPCTHFRLLFTIYASCEHVTLFCVIYYILYIVCYFYYIHSFFFSVKTPFARQIIHFLMPLLFINHSVPPLTQFHKVLLNTWFSCECFVYSTCFQLDVASLNLNWWFYIAECTTISVKNMFSTSCISHVV